MGHRKSGDQDLRIGRIGIPSGVEEPNGLVWFRGDSGGYCQGYKDENIWFSTLQVNSAVSLAMTIGPPLCSFVVL